MSVAAFRYSALDAKGRRTRGVVSAATAEDARRRVRATGLTPVALRPVKSRRAGKGRVAAKEVSQFTRQLATLLRARIPLAEGLRSIAEQEPNARLRAALMDVAAAIQAGSSVTDALRAHERIFGAVYVETVRAAETTGNMTDVLEHLAEMLESQAESRQQLKQALTYPALVLLALGGAAVFLIAVVVPRFATMFEQRGVELPALTRALEAVGVSFRGYWWAYGAGVLGVAVGLRKAWGSARGREMIDAGLHRLPYAKRVLTGLAVGRFARVLGIALSSGLGLLEALEVSARATGRPLLIREASWLVDEVRRGGRLREGLKSCDYTPVFARRMIGAGEESGELPRMCGVVAEHYERETAHLIRNASTVIEPVLIALLTVVVMVIALAVFLPMWDMVKLVG